MSCAWHSAGNTLKDWPKIWEVRNESDEMYWVKVRPGDSLARDEREGAIDTFPPC